MSFLKLRIYDATDFDRELGRGIEKEYKGKTFELTIGKYKVSIWVTKLAKIYKVKHITPPYFLFMAPLSQISFHHAYSWDGDAAFSQVLGCSSLRGHALFCMQLRVFP
jgi:hypothetical protein